jgi:hypothetical protein
MGLINNLIDFIQRKIQRVIQDEGKLDDGLSENCQRSTSEELFEAI